VPSSQPSLFHFKDISLYETFISKIPRYHLIELLRKDDKFRGRHFRGFRITESTPTRKQVNQSFKSEILDHKNIDLGLSLSTLWASEEIELVKALLVSFGMEINGKSEITSWLRGLRLKLSETSENNLRSILSTLLIQFPLGDLLILISMVSEDNNYQTLRLMAEDESMKAAKNVQHLKGQAQNNLAKILLNVKELEAKHLTIQSSRDEDLLQAQSELDSIQKQHDEIKDELTTKEASLQAVKQQFAQLKETLIIQESNTSELRQKKDTLFKNIRRQHNTVAKIKAEYEKQLDMLNEELQKRRLQVEQLSTELTILENKVEAENKTDVTLTAIESSRKSAQPNIQLRDTIQMSPTLNGPGVFGNNAICYQGVQRIFRNAVVAFLRDRLPKIFPTDHIQKVQNVFGDDWHKGSLNANMSRQIQGTGTSVSDDYDLLGVNHFFSVFERFYDKIFALEAINTTDQVKPVKTRFLGNLKAIKDSRDPLSHPVDAEITFEEANHVLYVAKEILNWLGSQEAVLEISTLTAQLKSSVSENSVILRHLPSEDSIYLNFVGRDVLLNDLKSCFSNPDNKRALLAGDGGKGKSAAAYRFVQNLSSSTEKRFQVITWLSAKRKKFREGTSTTIESPDFTTFEEALNRLLDEFGATSQELSRSVKEKKSLLLEYMNEFPAFVIADDIDTLLEDDDIVSLFTHEIPQTQSAVLLTSRRAIPGIRTFTVQGFTAEEADQFIKSRIILYGLNSADFTTARVKEITRVTDSSPLYMDDILRVAKVLDIQKAIKLWDDKGGDEARKYALQREFEYLSLDARKTLIAATVADNPVSFAELESLLEFSPDRLLSSLEELNTLFLFPKSPLVEGEQRYQINLNTKKLVRLVESTSDLYARIENRSKALAGAIPHVGRGIIASLIRQAYLRVNAGQVLEAETILQGAITSYPTLPDLHGFLGYVYKRSGRVSDARTEFEAAFKLKSINAETYLQWIKLEIGAKEWSKAIAVADRALDVLPEVYEIIELKVSALRQAGFDMRTRLLYDKAEEFWRSAVSLVKQKIKTPETLPEGERKLNASLFYSIVVCLDMLWELEDRNYWLDRWEKEHPDDPDVARQKDYITRKRGSL